ncbi:immune inhibitor A [Streptomyces sp. N2-109]|uniref:Immune inhibitor A n=1 Tax=Streptomyces gossypii TaxID=2883101 RepID=A0ABT2JVD3_9ACTN|nr:immune inhibitor A [Streptomyces gossypii]MCT2591249.1 immune inhibitor A [Streptomyces gossypii]
MNSRQRSIRSRSAALATAVAALGATVLLPVSAAEAQPRPQPEPQTAPAGDKAGEQQPNHNLDGPFSKQQRNERQAALQKLATGDGDKGEAKTLTRNDSKVMKLGDGKYVELEREKTDKIFTILVEFGDKVDPQYGGDPGPLHNKIAKPDRADNNSTLWQEDFDREHFREIYFGDTEDSLKNYYEKQSSGRYSVDGTVSDWVKVDYNEARYGSNYCGDTTCPTVWDAIRDGVTSWTEDQKAQGKTDEEIAAQLAEYDEWDRYDYDGDGDFNESDGYIDHFQFIHAGEDESAGGGAQGTDAIWAHRWYAYGTEAGHTGPEYNKSGGTEIGDTGIWVGDYTAQPENGGIGVFAHEYGHDLGLPDHYDTTGTGENSVGFWSLMSSGSWLNKGKDAIGDSAGDLNAWDKFQLGWLDYETAKAATKSTHKLGYQSYQTKNPQALIVELPKKEVTTTITKPAEGEQQWWSGSGDDLRNTLTRSVDLTGKTGATLDLQGWWDIEENYDYLYTEVSTDGGSNWTPLDGTVDGEPLPRDGGDRPALHGVSESYRDLSYPLDEYAGKKFDIRFRYLTDGGVAQQGFTADAISITADGEKVLEDGAEGDSDNGWTKDGFSRIAESFTKSYEQFYIAENRQHVGYDKSLAHGPYNFGWASTRPDWVERYGYQTGLLVWLWDTSQKDNNVGVHPGEGLILPVDAHAKPEKWKDGSLMRARVQAYDSTFSWYPSSGMKLHDDGEKKYVMPKWGKPVFDDHKGTYWYESNPQAGVKVPDTNTRISILQQPFSGKTITVRVGPSTH